jgi:outer membrane protein OmpA-like peptidoglycan-associated protein
MQPRFAALLFALGLVDLAYVNLGLGHEVFADAARQPSIEHSAPPVEKSEPVAHEPSPAMVEPEPVKPDPVDPGRVEPGRVEPEPVEPVGVTRNTLPPEAPSTPQPTPAVVPPTPEPPLPGTPSLPGAREPAPAAAHTGASAAGAEALARTTEQPTTAQPTTAQPTTAQPTIAERAHDARTDGGPAPRASELPRTELTVGFPDKATALLNGRARQELLALAARLLEHPEYRVHIVGHADARGSRGFNRDLGGRRARAVTELLARAGVPRRQIEAESRGEDEPRAIGASERVWAANRRVEITLGNDRSETP